MVEEEARGGEDEPEDDPEERGEEGAEEGGDCTGSDINAEAPPRTLAPRKRGRPWDRARQEQVG